MKTLLILWSFILTTAIFTSCEMDELASPSSQGHSETLASRRTAPNGAVTYGGQGTGLNATITTLQNGSVVSNQTILSQTAILSASGGSLTTNYVDANLNGVVTVDSLSASITGANNQTVSQTSATNIFVTARGNVVTADYAASTATATCGGTTASSQIQNLVVNGQPVNVTGAPNQIAFFQEAGFYIVINEQSTNKKVKAKNLTVSALHIIFANAADVRVATSRVEIKC